MTRKIRIALIEDDADVLDALTMYLAAQAMVVVPYASAEAYLRAMPEVDVVVSDVRMPGLNGLDLQQRLTVLRPALPLILVTGHGDIAMAVAAIKAGAYDFIEKPFDEARLKSQIVRAVEERRQNAAGSEDVGDYQSRIADLSPRQREVMQRAVMGETNKEIANNLGISPRTVEDYRGVVMQRLGVRNLAELVRLVTWIEAVRGARFKAGE